MFLYAVRRTRFFYSLQGGDEGIKKWGSKVSLFSPCNEKWWFWTSDPRFANFPPFHSERRLVIIFKEARQIQKRVDIKRIVRSNNCQWTKLYSPNKCKGEKNNNKHSQMLTSFQHLEPTKSTGLGTIRYLSRSILKNLSVWYPFMVYLLSCLVQEDHIKPKSTLSEKDLIRWTKSHISFPP